MLVHYIQFFYPGMMVSETSSQRIMSREEMPNIPAGAYAFNYYSREEFTSVDNELLKGEKKDWSGTVYFGEKLNLEDVRRLPGNYQTLASNMECNKWEYVVKTTRGQCFPLRKQDMVIDGPGALKDFHHSQVWK